MSIREWVLRHFFTREYTQLELYRHALTLIATARLPDKSSADLADRALNIGDLY